MLGFLGHFFSWLGVGLPAFLFVITLVVFIHELGHFAVARLFRVRVEAFSIGFGREIFGFTDKKGTRWKVSWLPLGGYVKCRADAATGFFGIAADRFGQCRTPAAYHHRTRRAAERN